MSNTTILKKKELLAQLKPGDLVFMGFPSDKAKGLRKALGGNVNQLIAGSTAAHVGMIDKHGKIVDVLVGRKKPLRVINPSTIIARGEELRLVRPNWKMIKENTGLTKAKALGRLEKIKSDPGFKKKVYSKFQAVVSAVASKAKGSGTALTTTLGPILKGNSVICSTFITNDIMPEAFSKKERRFIMPTSIANKSFMVEKGRLGKGRDPVLVSAAIGGIATALSAFAAWKAGKLGVKTVAKIKNKLPFFKRGSVEDNQMDAFFNGFFKVAGSTKTVQQWRKEMKHWGTKDINRAARSDIGDGPTKQQQDFAMAARAHRESLKKNK